MWFLVSTYSSWLCQGGIWCLWQVFSYSEVCVHIQECVPECAIISSVEILNKLKIPYS